MNKDKRIDITLTIGFLSLALVLFNLLFYIFSMHQELILSVLLGFMVIFILILISSYDDYSPLPSSGAILTVPENKAAKTISTYLKKEFNHCDFNNEFKNDLVQSLKHEKIHWKISKFFKINALIRMKIEKCTKEGEPIIMADFWCDSYIPHVQIFNKFYPKFFLVDLIQTIFDFIYDLSRGTFFTNFHMRVQDTFSSMRLK